MVFSGCSFLSVYGPTYDFSEMGTDIISNSIRQSDLATPNPDKRILKITQNILNSLNKDDAHAIAEFVEANDAKCDVEFTKINCVADRTFKRVWPVPTTGKLDHIENVHLTLFYEIEVKPTNAQILNLKLEYR